MAVEPSQQQVNHHFMEMAKGMVTDADIQSFGRGSLGGHGGKKAVNYRMCYPPDNVSTPIPNVTSDVAQTVEQAKSRLGRSVRLDTNLDNEPVTRDGSKRKSGKRKTSRRQKRKRDSSSSSKSEKGRKRKRQKKCK